MAHQKLRLTKEQKNKISKVITRVPKNEEEVKRIFYILEDVLGFEDVRVFNSYPDASAFHKGKKIKIEFEKKASHFRLHGHDEALCDLVVCWENDDPSLKISVLELATLVDDWLKARIVAMEEYNEYLSLDKVRANKSRIKHLFDKYDFDSDDALAHLTGLTRSGLKYYSSIPSEET